MLLPLLLLLLSVQDELFSQPPRKPQSRQTISTQRSIEEAKRYLSKTEHKADSKKPPRSAWTREPHYSPHKNTPKKANSEGEEQQWNRQGTERTKAVRSQRHRTYSQVEQVQTLYSPAERKTVENRKETRKELTRSRSEDALNKDTIQPTQLTGVSSQTNLQTGSDGCLDTDRSAASSKLLSREPLVKSQRPTTKTLRLGELLYLYTHDCFVEE